MRVLTFATLLAAGLAACAADAKLTKLAVLHRHGARSGSSVIEGQVICDYPHCQLTGRGIDQLKKVGEVLMATYKDALNIPKTYNATFISSVSTEVPRVVVSAQAVLQGMYKGQEPLPYIKFDLDADNTMLSPWNSVPSYVLANRYDVALRRINPITEEQLPESNISYIADFLGMRSTCVDKHDPFTCVAIIYDNYNCNYTDGLPVDPNLTEMLPRLKAINAQFVNYMLGYQPTTNEWSREVGSLGHQWASDVLSFLAGTDRSAEGATIKHYGAHDWTITSLFGALGFVTAENAHLKETVPMFAQTLVFELHETADAAPTVRVLTGYPSNAPFGPINFTLADLAVRCTDANGTAYDGTGGCPLEDLTRYVAGTAPQSPDGQCHYTRELMEGVDCLNPAAPAPKSRCLFFRRKCPQVPCGMVEGSIADPRRGYACSSLEKADDPPYFAATVVALVGPSILVGALVGFFASTGIRKFLYKKSLGSSDDRQPLNQS